MIPTSIDGTDITGATIDGTDVTEITVDGQTVFTAGPPVFGFESGDFTNWGGSTSQKSVVSSPVTEGSFAAQIGVDSDETIYLSNQVLSRPFTVKCDVFHTTTDKFGEAFRFTFHDTQSSINTNFTGYTFKIGGRDDVILLEASNQSASTKSMTVPRGSYSELVMEFTTSNVQGSYDGTSFTTLNNNSFDNLFFHMGRRSRAEHYVDNIRIE